MNLAEIEREGVESGGGLCWGMRTRRENGMCTGKKGKVGFMGREGVDWAGVTCSPEQTLAGRGIIGHR